MYGMNAYHGDVEFNKNAVIYSKGKTQLEWEFSNIKQEYDTGKNAISFLCMLNPHYVIAVCIAAYAHRKLISMTGRDIKIIVMCDKTIYDGYKDILAKYCDVVTQIQLIECKMSMDYKYAKNKYNWLQYSLNKWQCLKYDEYDKILFCDADILPVDCHFYYIFDLNAPAFDCEFPEHIRNRVTGNCISATNGMINFRTYIDEIYPVMGTADGGLCMFKPSRDDYCKYMKFADNVFRDGLYSSWKAGPDETSIYYFYLHLMKKPVSIINKLCNIVPWENSKNNCENAYGYNFRSFIKPWLKERRMQWDEEKLWTDIFKAMMPCGKLVKLSNEQITKQNTKYLNMTRNEQNKYYGQNKRDDYGTLKIKDLEKIIRQ